MKLKFPHLLLIWTPREVRGQSSCAPHWKDTPNFITAFLAAPLRQTGIPQRQHVGTGVHTLLSSPKAVLCQATCPSVGQRVGRITRQGFKATRSRLSCRTEEEGGLHSLGVDTKH